MTGVDGTLIVDGRWGIDGGLLDKGSSSKRFGVEVFAEDPIILATGACGRENCVSID